MRAGAFGVIFDSDRRVLLCHRRDMDAWNLPGGGVEAGETPWDAVIREVAEEVGARAEVVRLGGLYFKPDQDEIVFNFECQIVEGTPTTSDEAAGVGYFPLEAMPPNTSPKQAERIRDLFSLCGGPPTLRVQTGPHMRDIPPRR